MNEYAIMDDKGVQFGMPAKTFASKAAADAVLQRLVTHRAQMNSEAEVAERQLAEGVDSVQAGQLLQEAVARWRAEEPRQWTVYVRTVMPWVIL